METIIKIRPSELTVNLLEKLQYLLKGNDNYEITIQVAEKPSRSSLRLETKDEYKERLDKAISNVEKGESVVAFSLEEFSKLSGSL
ncbi:hypothetical protein FHS57_001275 [Runella defluvii]|uniref:Uncharacterized protein n=1 Tax=Runella defluvii TaxID=370973 RepID=A0A7W5ZK74_9BACT|nr:hypothetical protein [Runella defluvii]MBB3837281.1 hypothetical protein [Runella defluvii]